MIRPARAEPPARPISCATCADAAEPMRVVLCDPDAELALCVDETGRRVQVDLGLLGGVSAGETLLVHAGTALTRTGP